MTEIEKVEKLCEKANVSFAEAKDALDMSGGDVLDALIYLEKQGKTSAPEGGGFYTGAEASSKKEKNSQRYDYGRNERNGSGESFSDLMRRFGRFCMKLIDKSLNNYLVATKGDDQLFSVPILLLVLLLCISFWIIPFVFVITLFCGFRYHFTGEDLGKDSVNSVMDSATDVVEDVKKAFTDGSGGSNSSGGPSGSNDKE